MKKKYSYQIWIFAVLVFTCCSNIEDTESNLDNTNPTKMLYSWIQAHADGQIDTVFATDTSYYPGSTSTPMEFMSDPYGPRADTVINPPSGSFDDTLYLNYGPQARDSMVIPRITIQNKADLIASLDTISLGGSAYPSYPIEIQHFRGDQAQLESSDTNLLRISFHPTRAWELNETCELGETISIERREDSKIFPTNNLMLRVPRGTSRHSIIFWQLIVRNRFGFADTLQGSSYLKPLDCTEVTFTGGLCRILSVTPHPRDTMYSWIEPYADGHQDTIWSTQQNRFPGTTPIQLKTYTSLISYNDVIMTIFVDTMVCPGDSLWISTQGHLNWKPKIIDSVPLNYGPNARFDLVEPRISIIHKDSILALVDTAQFSTQPLRALLPILHFTGDSATVEVIAPGTPMSLIWDFPYASGCVVSNYCQQPSEIFCTDVDYFPNYETNPILTLSTLDSTSTGLYSWTLIVRNRFGYVDSLQGSTRIIPFSCADS